MDFQAIRHNLYLAQADLYHADQVDTNEHEVNNTCKSFLKVHFTFNYDENIEVKSMNSPLQATASSPPPSPSPLPLATFPMPPQSPSSPNLSLLSPTQLPMPSLGSSSLLVPTTPALLQGTIRTCDTLRSQTYRYVHVCVNEKLITTLYHVL